MSLALSSHAGVATHGAVKQSLAMAKSTATAELGARITQIRMRASLTQTALGKTLGVTRSSVSQWESGLTEPTQENLRAIAVLGNVSFDWLATGRGSQFPEGRTEADKADAAGEVDTVAPVLIPHDQLQTPGRPDFKIFASAEGGPGQIILSTEPVDFQPRPTILQNVRDAYGLIIAGDSMSPEYRNGDTALINPHLPAIGDEVYVFYSERQGEARATIKHLRRATADKWLVSQHNPPHNMPKDFTLPRAEWRIAHRVLGKYARR